jgi:hypothetical protein
LQEIETWVAALGRYDNNEFDDALGEFDKIADTSKILFNMGVIHATLGEHEKAVSVPMLAEITSRERQNPQWLFLSQMKTRPLT